MLKTKAKYLIAILLFLFALMLSNTSTVNAVVTQEEEQKLLDLVPDEIYLDIPEIEYEKADNMLKSKIEQIWKENGIDVTNIGNIVYSAYYPYDINKFYEGYVHTGTLRKAIKITYNNTKDKNASDEQYVKSLSIKPPKYYEIDVDNNIISNIQKYYNNLIDDKTITLKYVISSGEIELDNLNTYNGTGNHLLIFRNGNIYDSRYIETKFTIIPVINVASNVRNNDINDYVENKIQNFYSSFNVNFNSFEKGCTWNNEYANIPNIYTLSGNKKVAVIINREIADVGIKDETTNIKIDTDTTVLPANTKLVVKELTEGETYKVAEKLLTNDVDKMYVYDITLQSEGVTVQPDGKVKVSIPIPEGLDTNKLVVYSINDNGTKTEYTVKVETVDNIKYATFETNHFSTYVLGEKAEETTTTNTETTAKGEKDETPKTGATATIAGITALVILIGTVVIIKKCK